MSLTVTPEPDNVPPRVRIDMSVSTPGRVFADLTLYRDGRALRERPPAGGAESVSYDYEAPFGVSSTYRLTGTEAGQEVAFTETWSDLAAWSTESGTPSVASGVLSGACRVSRTQGLPNAGALTGPSGHFSPTNAPGTAVLTLGGPNGIVRTLSRQTTNGPITLTTTVGGQTADGAGHLSWSPQGTVMRRTDGSTVSMPPPIFTTSTWTAEITALAFMANFELIDSSTLFPVDLSSAATLYVDEAWLIHPGQPTLSRSIDPGAGRWRDDGLNVDPTTSPEAAYAARRNEYEVIGRKRGIVVTSGPRAAGEWNLVLFAPRLEDRDAALELLDDQTSLLLRSPSGWPWDLTDGWYSVGDVTVSRTSPNLISPRRRVSLPLTPVDPPAVRVAATRTWGDLLLENAEWSTLTERYDTWLDVLTGDLA